MPIDPVTGSLIVAGVSGISQGANAFAQGKMNKKTRKWNEQMYDRQKEDNLSNWHLQNEYNSPQNQMQRLREAGLNPNLVYGHGADATAQSIPQNSSPASWNPKAPEVDLGRMAQDGLGTYNDVQLKQAQVDNVKMATTVAAQDAILKGAQTAQTQLDTKKGESTFDYFVDATKANLRKLQIDNEYSITERGMGLEEQVLRLNNNTKIGKLTDAQIKNITSDTQLKDLDIWLKQNGINPNDPMVMRMLAQGAKELLNGLSVSEWVKKFKNKIMNK